MEAGSFKQEDGVVHEYLVSNGILPGDGKIMDRLELGPQFQDGFITVPGGQDAGFVFVAIVGGDLPVVGNKVV